MEQGHFLLPHLSQLETVCWAIDQLHCDLGEQLLLLAV